MSLGLFHQLDPTKSSSRSGRRLLPLAMTGFAAACLALAVMAPSASATPGQGTTTVTPRGELTPESSSGCTLSLTPVCIYVNGTGLHVNYVTSTGYPTDENGDVVGELTENGSPIMVTNPVVWSDEIVVLSSEYDVDANFANNTQLCVQYVGAGAPDGAACETIEG